MLEGLQRRAASSHNVFLTEPLLEAGSRCDSTVQETVCPRPIAQGLFEMQRGQCLCPAFGGLTITVRHLADTDWTGAASGHLHGADVCIVSSSSSCVCSFVAVRLRKCISNSSSRTSTAAKHWEYSYFNIHTFFEPVSRKKNTNFHLTGKLEISICLTCPDSGDVLCVNHDFLCMSCFVFFNNIKNIYKKINSHLLCADFTM